MTRLNHSALFLLLVFLLSTVEGFSAEDVKLSTQSESAVMTFAGLQRTYVVYIPANLPASPKPPLVLILHGHLGTGASMEKLTLNRFDELADRDGFIALYPDGIDKSWNDGRNINGDRAHREQVNDLGFLSALIDLFENQHSVDPRKVFVTGISNGAMMSSRLACELSDKIAAAAPVAGSIPKDLVGNCLSKDPVSMMFIHGDKDPLVPFNGGQVGFLWRKRGEVIPVKEAAAFWAKRDGCGMTPKDENLPDRDPNDHTTVEKFSYSPSIHNDEVILYVIHGGGHTWPMGRKYAGEWLVGRVSKELDACDVILEFFKSHPKKSGPK